MNDKWQTIFIIEAISRDIMQLSIRMEIIGVKDADLKIIEAGAKQILGKVEKLREMENATDEQTETN